MSAEKFRECVRNDIDCDYSDESDDKAGMMTDSKRGTKRKVHHFLPRQHKSKCQQRNLTQLEEPDS